jgi:transposase
MVAAALVATVEQKAQLERMAASTSLPHRQVVQARGLLWVCEGMANDEIGRRCGVDSDAVRRWRSRFASEGTEGVGRIAKGRGRKPGLPAGTVEEVLRLIHKERPADGSTHWSTRTMAARVGIGKDSVAKWRPSSHAFVIADGATDFETEPQYHIEPTDSRQRRHRLQRQTPTEQFGTCARSSAGYAIPFGGLALLAPRKRNPRTAPTAMRSGGETSVAAAARLCLVFTDYVVPQWHSSSSCRRVVVLLYEITAAAEQQLWLLKVRIHLVRLVTSL